jgi:hypothetical protein
MAGHKTDARLRRLPGWKAVSRLPMDFGRCQAIGRTLHEPDDPRYIINADLSVLPLKVQASLSCAYKCFRVCIAHKPLPPLSLPLGGGANFATKIDQHRVPVKSHATHLLSPITMASNRTAPRSRSATAKRTLLSFRPFPDWRAPCPAPTSLQWFSSSLAAPNWESSHRYNKLASVKHDGASTAPRIQVRSLTTGTNWTKDT